LQGLPIPRSLMYY